MLELQSNCTQGTCVLLVSDPFGNSIRVNTAQARSGFFQLHVDRGLTKSPEQQLSGWFNSYTSQRTAILTGADYTQL